MTNISVNKTGCPCPIYAKFELITGAVDTVLIEDVEEAPVVVDHRPSTRELSNKIVPKKRCLPCKVV